jgi:uncharacterized protein YqeY
MTLEQKVMEALKQAMKEKDRDKMDALRAIKSAILLEKTKGGSKELTEADELKLLQKLVKQRKESAGIYQQQNRPDLAETELNQIKVIEQFLPAQLSEEEIEAEVSKIIAQTGATSMRDMGKVMGLATQAMAGRAEGKTIAAIVKKLLS